MIIFPGLLDHDLYTKSPLGGHLGCFRSFTIVFLKSALMNILVANSSSDQNTFFFLEQELLVKGLMA